MNTTAAIPDFVIHWWESSSSRASTFYFGIAIGGLLVFGLWREISDPLASYPGPFLARWTNLWRLYRIWLGSFHKDLELLHKRYGSIVRIGPNVVDLDMPDMVKTVFSTKDDWRKTDYYHGSSVLVNGQTVYNLFSQPDPEQHARERRPIAKHYSMLGVLPMEPHVDGMINLLCSELMSRFVDGRNAERTCDLGAWINFFTWDVVGVVTFSQPLGYLAKGCDFDGTLHTANRSIDYFSLVGCIPVLDRLLDKNGFFSVAPSFGTIAAISIKRLIDRCHGADGADHDPASPDFLDRFLEARQSAAKGEGAIINDAQIVSWLMINMIAGADTTAITIRSALYYLLKSPHHAWQRLRKELRAAGVGCSGADGENPTPVPYKDARAVPYLEAVVREALRMLPGVSLPLERYVPPGGCVLPDDRGVLPGGSVAALSPYVLARNEAVWGADAHEFRPERWLRAAGESEDEFGQRVARMNGADLSFGGGSRMCIGKNLGLLETYKTVATLVSKFDIELVHPDRDWKVIGSWFPRQEDLVVRLRPIDRGV